MNPQGAPPEAAWIAIPIVLLVVFLRMRRLSRERKLRVEWLWVTPVLLLVIAGLVMTQTPLAGFDWLWLVPAFAVGAGIGFWRGRLTTVTVDPASHALTSRASPAALYLLVAVLVVRIGLRFLLTAEASALHVNAALITGRLPGLRRRLGGYTTPGDLDPRPQAAAEARAAGASADVP